jgi:hypothetical protein
MEVLDENIIVPVQTFFKNSKHLVQKCAKPNYNDFMRSVAISRWSTCVLDVNR